MGCVASKFEGGEEEVVSICRERKRLIKLAVERRYAFAEAHGKYFQSMYAVAAAIKLFVARHSSPSSPFLITFPPSSTTRLETEQETLSRSPKRLQHCEAESVALSAGAGRFKCELRLASPASSDISEDERGNENSKGLEDPNYKYFCMQMPPHSQSPTRDFGWDFFYPFDVMRPEYMNGCIRNSEDELRAVREQEGIPELEDEGANHGEINGDDENWINLNNLEEKTNEDEVAKVVSPHEIGINQKETEQNMINGIRSPEKGRELLDGLKDVMDHFVRACDSGRDVSRMLETRNIYLQPEAKEIPEKSTKVMHALPWHRGTLSCKSLVVSHNKNMSEDSTNDIFNGCGGMDSGSHSLTLERLFAWENKLYDEVKAGDNIRRIYEKTNLRMRRQMARGEGDLSLDKTRAAMKDLQARILVAIRRAESMSKKIEKLRDEELQPQIIELLTGLSRTWEVILRSHETQSKIMLEVKSFEGLSLGKFCNDSHRLATLQLEAELQNWRGCFTEYIASQIAYVQALYGWMTKFVVPEIEFNSRPRYSSAALFGVNGPPLLSVFRAWLCKMERLPDKPVLHAIKSFAGDVRTLCSLQGEEQQQKRRVDNLAKELERKTLAVEREESRLLEIQMIEYKPNPDAEPLIGRLHLNIISRKLQAEKEKHQNFVLRTRRTTLNEFQAGFASIFEALKEFSLASLKMYNGLAIPEEKARKDRATIMESQPLAD